MKGLIVSSNYSITLELSYYSHKIRVKFNGSCLKEDKITYTHGRIVNIYIVYEITENYNISNYPTLENRLFGAVSLTKHTDIDHCKYSGYGIGFSRNDEFSFDNGYGKNIIIFGVETSNYSIHTKKIRSHLILGEDFMQGLVGTTIYVEKLYSINFTEKNKAICLSLHYNGDNSYLSKAQKIIKFNAKDSEIVAAPFCLGNISKDLSVDNIKKTWLNGCAYDFSFNYDAITVDDILEVHKYLIKNNRK